MSASHSGDANNLSVATSFGSEPELAATPTQLAGSLIAYIENLIATNVIGNDTGTSLINADLKQITDTTGIAQMNAFIAQVQKDEQQGKIPQANADYMIAQAELILSGLTS
jgi:hypothetical protein